MTTSGLLGQTSFTAATLGHSPTTMNGPSGLKYDAVNSRLFVGDYTNSPVSPAFPLLISPSIVSVSTFSTLTRRFENNSPFLASVQKSNKIARIR